MADDREKTENTDEGTAKPKKSGKMLWLVIGAVVLAAAGGGYFLGFKSDTPEGEGTQAETVEEEPAGLVALDTFLVNLADPEGDRYMKLTLRLTISPVSGADKINADDLALARIRDRVLTVLTSKTFGDMSNPLGKESLRHEIQTQLQPVIEQA